MITLQQRNIKRNKTKKKKKKRPQGGGPLASGAPVRPHIPHNRLIRYCFVESVERLLGARHPMINKRKQLGGNS